MGAARLRVPSGPLRVPEEADVGRVVEQGRILLGRVQVFGGVAADGAAGQELLRLARRPLHGAGEAGRQALALLRPRAPDRHLGGRGG